MLHFSNAKSWNSELWEIQLLEATRPTFHNSIQTEGPSPLRTCVLGIVFLRIHNTLKLIKETMKKLKVKDTISWTVLVLKEILKMSIFSKIGQKLVRVRNAFFFFVFF